MKTIATATENIFEARSSTSRVFMYTAVGRENFLDTEGVDTSFETDVSDWAVDGCTVTRDTTEKKFGAASAKFVLDTEGLSSEQAYIAVPNEGTYDGKNLLFSCYCKTSVAHQICFRIQDDGGNNDERWTVGTTWKRIWVVCSAAETSSGTLKVGFENEGPSGGAFDLFIDAVQLEETTAGTPAMYRSTFIDVDSAAHGVNGFIGTIEISGYLRDQIDIDEVADESMPAPLMAFSKVLRWTMDDVDGYVSTWTKRGTGILVTVGTTSATTYANQVKVFHGIIWDWRLVPGTETTYEVEARDLSELWKQYIIGAEALEGPREWGITEYSVTSQQGLYIYNKGVGKFLWKGVYNGQQINRMHAQVCKWPFASAGEETHFTHLMFPLESSKAISLKYFDGQDYASLVSYFEGKLGISSGMPAAYIGCGGDTLTAQTCGWSYLKPNVSAWRQLADAAGRKYYGFRYNENGQLVLKNLAGTRTLSTATTRSSATPGNIRKWEDLEDVYMVNDPTVEFTRYGVNSATGSSLPVQTTTSYYVNQLIVVPSMTDCIGLVNASSVPMCPAANPGDVYVDTFATQVTPINDGTDINTYLEAQEVGTGSVVIAGDGTCVLTGVDADNYGGLNGIATMGAAAGESASSWAVSIRVSLAASSYCLLWTSYNTTYWFGITLLQGGGGAEPLGYSQGGGIYGWGYGVSPPSWAATGGPTPTLDVTAGTDYWLTLAKFGGSYYGSVCDAYGCPLGTKCCATKTVGVQAADNLQIGPWGLVGTVTVKEFRYHSPTMPMIGAIKDQSRRYTL